MICHHFHILRLFLTVVMVALGGCVSIDPIKLYEPGLDESKIATIHRYTSYKKDSGYVLLFIIPIPHKLKHETFVSEVDGRDALPDAWGGVYNPKEIHTDIVLVGAGPHTVKLNYQRDTALEVCTQYGCSKDHEYGLPISFVAEGKHEYRFFAYIQDERKWIWGEDETSGKIVAGEKPPGIVPSDINPDIQQKIEQNSKPEEEEE